MQSTLKYKAGMISLVLGVLLALMPVSSARGADCGDTGVCTGFGQCWATDAQDLFTMGRISPADWDLSIWATLDGSLTLVGEEEAFAWQNWVQYPFSVNYRKSDGLVTYTLNGSTVLTAATPAGRSFEYIVPIVSSLSAGTGAELSNMTLNGFSLCDLRAFDDFRGFRIPFNDALQTDGFTLAGNVRLSWISPELQTVPAFYVYALNAHMPVCTDGDGDGTVVCDGTCEPGALVCGDCDDSDADFSPLADELCDGLDNDCDNDTDEDFPELGTGCTAGLGACETAGTLLCAADGLDTACSAVPGVPGTEGPQGDLTCSDGIDNNCNGWTDAQDSGCTPPPLPQFQTIGREDILYNDLTEVECRLCHGNQGDGFSMPDRHHLLVGEVIPDFTLSSGGTPGEIYTCLTCHPAECVDGVCEYPVERDCMVCHMQGMPSDLTVHHRSNLAQGTLPQGPDCKICHGSVVDNKDDGHFISAEPVLESTPRRSGGVGEPLNSRGNGSGACNYCHDEGLSSTGLNVVNNLTTHHNTGLGYDSTKCGWCHDFSLPFQEQIRVCENCHARDSLHNIQTDSNGDGVIEPGVELPYYGHVGNPEDCWGCHGYGPASTIAPESGMTVPSLYAIDETFITAWYDTPLTLTGSAFESVDNATVHTSEVALVDGDGVRTTLIPDTITMDTIQVTIPGITLPGTYLVKVVKMGKESNALALMVKPEVRIAHITCEACTGEITITGAGYGTAPIEENQDIINVTEDGIPLSVLTWSEYQIKAVGSTCSGTIAVNNVFGTASMNID